MFQPFRPSQPSIVSAIMTALHNDSPDSQCDVALMNKVIEAANMVCDECARERTYANKTMTPKEWLASDDVGLSSKFMLHVLIGSSLHSQDGAIPHDIDDLGRCVRMVRACGLEQHVGKMSGHGKHWERIAENWSQLVDWYDNKQSKAVYEFLNS